LIRPGGRLERTGKRFDRARDRPGRSRGRLLLLFTPRHPPETEKKVSIGVKLLCLFSVSVLKREKCGRQFGEIESEVMRGTRNDGRNEKPLAGAGS
jgi:hypothetical protein